MPSDPATSLERGADGALCVRGHSVVTLAAEYGTPLHVVDEGVLRRTARAVRAACEDRGAEVFFSYKTNGLLSVLAALHDEGIGAEVFSAYELWLAERLGVPPARTVVNGIAKSAELLEGVAARGARLVNVDSRAEIEALARLTDGRSEPLAVGLRVAPRAGWRAHFGFEGDGVEAAAAAVAAAPGLELAALSAHIGTNVVATEPYVDLVHDLADLVARVRTRTGVAIGMLDVGGGFGIAGIGRYRMWQHVWLRLFGRMPAARTVRTPPFHGQLIAIAGAVQEAFRSRSMPVPAVLVEPGRALSGAAQTLLVRVRAIKRRASGRRFAITDGGAMGVAPILAHERHRLVLANRAGDGPELAYRVTGPLGTPADRLDPDARLPELRPGDLLAVADAGAYFTATECCFAFPRPACVMVSERGDVALIRRRESHEDMVAMQDRSLG